jgi:hypothetical protein
VTAEEQRDALATALERLLETYVIANPARFEGRDYAREAYADARATLRRVSPAFDAKCRADERQWAGKLR